MPLRYLPILWARYRRALIVGIPIVISAIATLVARYPYPYIALSNAVFYSTLFVFIFNVFVLLVEKEAKMILVCFAIFASVNIMVSQVCKNDIKVEKLVRSFSNKGYLYTPMREECGAARNVSEIDRIFENHALSEFYIVHGISGSGKTYYFNAKARTLSYVLYYEVRVGHSIDEKLYELVFGRDENLALNMIDIFHQALRLRSVLPDKMNVEQIFNFFKENRDRIFRLLGKKIPFIIIDNFNLLADKDGKNLKSIYDSVKHSRDEKYLNLILVSNEGALPLLDLERGTNARVDNLLHMPELSYDEISQYISCCFRKYSERSGLRIDPQVHAEILPRLADEIGGNILYLQNFCTESTRNQDNKNLSQILQELIVRRRRDFQFLGVYLGELSFSENKMSSKQFLQLLQVFQALIDEGPISRQELILRTGRQLSIDIFRKNIIRLIFNETTHEFYVNFQTKLHRSFAEMMLGSANSTRRNEVVDQLRRLYNFELSAPAI